MRLRWNFRQHLHAEFAAGPGRRTAPLLFSELANRRCYSFKQAVGLHGAFVLYAFRVFILDFAKSHWEIITCSPRVRLHRKDRSPMQIYAGRWVNFKVRHKRQRRRYAPGTKPFNAIEPVAPR